MLRATAASSTVFASLPAGASISQPFAVEYARSYTLHIATKDGQRLTSAITDNSGNTLACIRQAQAQRACGLKPASRSA
jgi:hypothetical protein